MKEKSQSKQWLSPAGGLWGMPERLLWPPAHPHVHVSQKLGWPTGPGRTENLGGKQTIRAHPLSILTQLLLKSTLTLQEETKWTLIQALRELP